jgi:hypothetical protein
MIHGGIDPETRAGEGLRFPRAGGDKPEGPLKVKGPDGIGNKEQGFLNKRGHTPDVDLRLPAPGGTPTDKLFGAAFGHVQPPFGGKDLPGAKAEDLPLQGKFDAPGRPLVIARGDTEVSIGITKNRFARHTKRRIGFEIINLIQHFIVHRAIDNRHVFPPPVISRIRRGFPAVCHFFRMPGIFFT